MREQLVLQEKETMDLSPVSSVMMGESKKHNNFSNSLNVNSISSLFDLEYFEISGLLSFNSSKTYFGENNWKLNNLEDYDEDKNLMSSSVVNTGISDCFLRCGSLDQIGKNNFNASAKYGESFGSGINKSAFLNKVLYSLFSTNTTLLFNNSIILEKDLIFDFSINPSLYLYNSTNENSGASNINLYSDKMLFAAEEDFISANKTLASTINFNYINPSFFNLLVMPLLTFSPISTHQFSNSLSSSSCFNIFCFQDNSLVFSTNFTLTNPDQFISGNCSILCLTSGGIDKVMLTILNPPNYVKKHKYVEIFKPFDSEEYELVRIKDIYSEFVSGEKELFLSSFLNMPLLAFDFLLKNENNSVVSITNSIYNNPFCLSVLNLPFLTNLPSLTNSSLGSCLAPFMTLSTNKDSDLIFSSVDISSTTSLCIFLVSDSNLVLFIISMNEDDYFKCFGLNRTVSESFQNVQFQKPRGEK